MPMNNGVVRSSTLTLTVTEENLSGETIQCVFRNNLVLIRGGNATLVTYGIAGILYLVS